MLIADETILKNFLPTKPFCANNLAYGLKIKPREIALSYRYIQMNPVNIKKFLTFDIDRPFELYKGALKDFQKDYGENFFFSWNASIMPDERHVAPPLWFVQNPQNGHAHFIYVLTAPVCTSELAHIKPLKYLDFITKSYTTLLDADPLYTGLISKNPFNQKAWEVFNPVPPLEKCSYDLENLAGYIPMKFYEAKPVKKGREDVSGLGRNCYILETVRTWAYRERRKYWKDTQCAWPDVVLAKCLEVNSSFSTPLHRREVATIAKSITKWTIKNITPEGFSAWQRQKILLRWSKESHKKDGIDLFKQGCSVEEVMQALDISRRTAYRYKKEAENIISI